jgi:hypothetical protein
MLAQKGVKQICVRSGVSSKKRVTLGIYKLTGIGKGIMKERARDEQSYKS